jgi:cation transport regulator ChaC
MSVLYFAYGSCMDEVDFKRTISEFKTMGSATLKDYRLAFTLYGESRAGGVADVIPCEGEEVQGVLYEFPKELLPNLDQREGVHSGMYERIEVEVEHQGETMQVYTYQVINKTEDELAPSQHYLQLILNGMNNFAEDIHQKRFEERVHQLFGMKSNKNIEEE